MLVRALYFVFIGSWAGYIWACIGYAPMSVYRDDTIRASHAQSPSSSYHAYAGIDIDELIGGLVLWRFALVVEKM